MQTGALTAYLDVAQVVLYAFWVFFALLIFYIRQEDRREGYPLENDKTGEVLKSGWPFIPDAKTFRLAHGHGTVKAPDLSRRDKPVTAARRVGNWPGAPLEPIGNPLLNGVGPASWAERADRPDLTIAGTPKIVPMRVSHGYTVEARDPDPRGLPVVACDGVVAGRITDVWVDQSEHIARYLEAEVGKGASARRVLIAINFMVVKNRPTRRVYVNAITSAQFEHVPATKHPEQVTLLEEDRISAYFGGGTLYATPARSEPLI